ncbi:MAG: MFS transporter [Deltaproteobacteria bacterium]|nr:MFS transporter [Deltaproteobacteria bacterium]
MPPAEAVPPRNAAGSPREPEFGVRYSRYALGLLLAVYIVNFIDRRIVTILLEAIREEFGLSDFQLGFFSGTAFAIFYSTLGIPIARYADRGVRRNVIALALCVWSAMTALQGLARSFTVLALTRIGVGVGEAGCTPPAHSMISDFFPPNRRATALAIYAMGIPLGGALALMAGGWIRENIGWREAFVIVGLPGLLLALLVRLTLREPTRGWFESATQPVAAAANAAADAPRESFWKVGGFLLTLPTFVHISFAGALHAFYGYGSGDFAAPFFERIHGFKPTELGLLLGLMTGSAGVLGVFLGGWLTDRIAHRDLRWFAWLPGISTGIGIPVICLFYLWPERYTALALGFVPVLLGSMYLGPTFALTQALVPPRMRAQASAVLLLVLNLIGLGGGPQFVGWFSDLLRGGFSIFGLTVAGQGENSIRYALLYTVALGAAWSTLHYFLGARTLLRDLNAKAALEQGSPGDSERR